MKNRSIFHRKLFSFTIFLVISGLLSAAPMKETISGAQVESLIASGEEVTVPAETVYEVILPKGETVLLDAGTVFRIDRIGGEERVIIVTGTAVLPEGSTTVLFAGGTTIEAENAAVVVSVDGDEVAVSQRSPTGTVSVGGTVISTGSAGIVQPDGAFRPEPDIADDLNDKGEQVISVPVAPPAPEVPELPEEIDQENVNDITPS